MNTKTKSLKIKCFSAILLTVAGLASARAYALPYELSYMGRLTESNGMPISGPINVEVKFFRSLSGNDQVGTTLTFNSLTLADGVFQVNLTLTPADFHSVFPNDSSSTYIEITDVSHSKTYTRQKYNTVPYALKVPADGTNISYDVDGKLTVVGLKGTALPSAVPTTGQILKMGSGGLEWGSDLTGGAAGSVSTTEIQDGTVGNLDISASAAIAGTKIAPNFGSQNVVTTGTISGSGASMTGAINMGTTNKITNLADPTLGTDAATKNYADGVVAPYMKKDGTVPLTGNWAVGGFNISNVGAFNAGATNVTSLSAQNTSVTTLTTSAQAAITIEPNGTGAGQTSELRYKELAANGPQYVGFKAPDAIAANMIYVLPAADGAANQVLKTDGTGNLGWISPASTVIMDSVVDEVTMYAPSQNAVFDELALKVSKSGGSMTGALDLGSNKITNLGVPTATSDAATKGYADSVVAPYLRKDGSAMLTANWAVGGFDITGANVITTNGNVGVGITTPGARLHVRQTASNNTDIPMLMLDSSNSGVSSGSSIQFKDVSAGFFAAVVGVEDGSYDGRLEFRVSNDSTMTSTPLTLSSTKMVLDKMGNLGIGNNAPNYPLSLPNGNGDKIGLSGSAGNHFGLGIQTNQLQIHTDSSAGDIAFGYGSSSTMTSNVIFKGTGKVGIGVMAPTNTLGVAGSLCVTSSGTCANYASGTIYATTASVTAADLAEHMPVEDLSLKPGDIVVIEKSSQGEGGIFAKSSAPNQSNAAGVVSTRPGLVLGSETESSKPIALAGRVPVNVTVEGGSIQVGDYLVPSSEPGKAMRASSGADEGIIGIALSAYDGRAVAARVSSDGIAHEEGHQVMMLVQPRAPTAGSTADLQKRASQYEEENKRLKAFLCSKFSDAPDCK